MERVAGALDVPLAELLRSDGLDAARVPNGHPEAVPLAVRPLLGVLPLNALAPEVFELFVTELLKRQFPTADVVQLGGQGDDQRGYDILVTHPGGGRVGVQCKREGQFGPMKVRQAVAAGELPVDKSIIALSRRATAAARFEIDNHPTWQIHDQVDLSLQIRGLQDDNAQQVVRAYFPSHIEAFLGVQPSGPWMGPNDFYRDAPQVLLHHRQPLVGRDGTLAAIADWVIDPDGSNAGLLIGRGGLGKSKLLWEVASRTYDSEVHFRFLAVDQTPTPSDFDSLPRSGSLVVVVDDAHVVERVAGVAAQLWHHRPNAKLLLSTRPSGAIALENEISRLGLSPRHLMRWTIEDLSGTDARQLVASLIKRPVFDPVVQQLAAISADCPFVAVVASDLLTRGDLATSAFASNAALRTEVLRRYSELSSSRRGGLESNAQRETLTAIAAFQPVRLSDVDFENALTSMTGIPSWDEVNGRVRELEDLGLLLRRDGAVRVVPDMLGDIVLGQAAYDERAQRATTYLQRAQTAARGAALQHLLVNASRMDWQVRDSTSGRVDMVGQLWTTLRSELLEGTFDQQIDLLGLLEKVAFYQPTPAMELVEAVFAMDTGQSDTERPDGFRWTSSRTDVVHALAPVLRNIAYNLDFLPRALRILWKLAKADTRRPNQHPDHPLRVLEQMASLRTGKPLAYIEAVIDAAAEWLAEERSTVSPFDVLEPVLAVEGSDEVSSTLSLTFYSYPISPEAVRPLRSRVIDLAVAEARRDDVEAAVRGIRALERAIRAPFGRFGRTATESERAVWNKEFIPTIRGLGRIGSEPQHDPVVRIAIRQALGWHAAHGARNTKAAAKAALAALATSFTDELALCLHDGWGRLAFREGGNYKEAERRQAVEFNRVAVALTSGRTPDEVLDVLEQRLRAERRAFEGGNPARFLWEAFSVAPSVAVRLGSAALDGEYPETSRFVERALGALASTGHAEAVTIAAQFASSSSTPLALAAAWAFSWGRGSRAGLLPGELELLGQLAGDPEEAVRSCLGRAVYMIGLSDKATAIDLAANIDFGRSGKVAAEVLSAFANEEPLSWAETGTPFRDLVLERLLECDSIDEHELISALGALSLIEPLKVTQFLLRRLEHAERPGYDALPHEWNPPLQVNETRDLARCLVEVREWMSREDDSRPQTLIHDDAASIYTIVAGGWSAQAVVVLADVGATTPETGLLAVARILAQAPASVFFDNVGLVAQLLHRAEALGEPQAKRLFQMLLPTNHGVFAVWSGDPMDGEVHDRDRARLLSNELPRGSIESRFFETLANALESRLAFGSDWPERTDGRDW